MSLDTTLETSNSLMGRLETIVLDHLDHEDFDVETFALKAGMSRSELYRKIKKFSGKSVTQFIRDIRLRKSLELLNHGEYTASEVAYRVGFNSPTYFNKCFKERFGFTPGDSASHQLEIQTLLDDPEPEIHHNNRLSKVIVLIVILLLTAGILISLIFSPFGATPDPSIPDQNTEVPPADPSGSAEEANINTSIAMLPLLNWTGDAFYDFICNGITDAVISKISTVNSIDRVTPMSSVIPYQDSIQNLKTIAEDLGVTNILHGSLQKAGSRLKFSVEFVNARTGELHWSDEFVIDWVPEDAFEMQDDIAERVIMAMGIKETAMADNEIPTRSIKAYNYFLQGVYQGNILTREAWENSIYFYNKAIEEDPQYINAHLYLAFTWGYGGMNWSYTSQEEAWSMMKENLEKILELDPDHPSVPYFLRDGYFYYGLNAADHIEEYPIVSLDEMLNFNADFATKTGRHRKGKEGNLKWIHREPYNGSFYALLAINHYFLGNPGEARKLLADNYEVYKDDLNFLREAAKAWYFLEDRENLEKAVLHFFDTFDERPKIMRWLRAIVADNNGNTEMVREQLDILEEAYHQGDSGSPAWFLALYEARKGNYQMALEWLERSYAAREVEMTWLAQEPDLAPLGDAPRYRALLDSMQFPQSARRHVNSAIITQN